MLSILIPTYNYYIYDLVLNIHEKCLKENFDFEIICLDDNSDANYTKANKKIEELSSCYYKINSKNKGRVATREHLAKLAKNKWLLFLDADVIPKNDNFITKYLNYIDKDYKAVFGGFYYDENSNKKHLLRWKYGKQKEEVTAQKRNLNPYKVIISANLLIKKDTYLSLSKQVKTNTYGGDLIFAALLKEQNINILHIDNEVIHLGLEDNKVFLKKQKEAVKLLYDSVEKREIINHDNSLLKTYSKIKKYNLDIFFSWFYKSFNKRIERHLLGQKPKILFLQLLKLSYLSYLYQKN
ncbi:glycosyltransferase family 2 protein [Mesoflavibacter zeaxanthinifaciens]|uniref:glycosyltransferase family 2 protein n=1 Tax=Mesoflavibacter zeaxanthinifaciens TaxID=393060 RepID=UPI003A952F70